MRVPSDFQIPVTAPRSGVLEALGLKIGETLTAQVVGQNANGSTLVQIGNQQVSLQLPQQFPPGTELQFNVKGGGTKLELALIATNTKPGASVPTSTPPAQAQPQVIVSDSILNQTAQTKPGGRAANFVPPAPSSAAAQASGSQNTPQANSAYPHPPTGSQPSGQPLPPTSAPSVNGGQTASASAAQTGSAAPTPAQQTSIPLPPQISANLSLAAGQSITARVVPPNAQGQMQVSVNGQTFPVTSASLPAPGSVLQGQLVAQNGQLALNVQSTKSSASPYPTLTRASAPAQTVQSAHSQPQTPATSTSASVAQAAIAPHLNLTLPAPNLSQVAAEAVVKQDSLGKLIATITGLSTSASKDLPNNVAQFARQIADAPLKPQGQSLTASALRDAVARSGVFLETTLARGALPQSGPQGDLKSMLMLLRNALGNWLEGDPLPQPKGQKPAPPMRGAPPRPDGQTPQNPLANGASAREAGRQMLAQTESALSRMRLFQLSSLPEAGQRGNLAAAQELQFELPMALGGQAAMAQFQVTRDGGDESNPTQRGWQMSFAVNFGAIGAVGAKVSFRVRKTGVIVWAENEETARVLEEMLPELNDGLEAQGLELSSVRIRHRMPDAPLTDAGGFVDSVS